MLWIWHPCMSVGRLYCCFPGGIVSRVWGYQLTTNNNTHYIENLWYTIHVIVHRTQQMFSNYIMFCERSTTLAYHSKNVTKSVNIIMPSTGSWNTLASPRCPALLTKGETHNNITLFAHNTEIQALVITCGHWNISSLLTQLSMIVWRRCTMYVGFKIRIT